MPNTTITTSTLAGSLISLTFMTKIGVLAGVTLGGSLVYMLTERKQAIIKGDEYTKTDMAHSFIIGIFSGSMFFLASVMFIDDWIAGFVSAGVGSFKGINGLTLLGNKLIDAFKRD